MKVFNTLGRRLEELLPRRDGEISMYVCGATVQAEPHVGHGRSAVAFDVIRRYLEWRGYRVRYVRNITDVEDKIIAAASEQNTTVEELANRMWEKFDHAYRAMGVREPTVEPRATEHIAEMLALVEQLIDEGLAYPADGDVYFSVRKFPGYGRLSGRNLDDLQAGARVEPGEHKRDPLDFALWKAAKPGEPSWESPWGPGRPGWHIECSAMAAKYLGAGFDIHAGGTDLIFPHHENEIAQSEGATDRPFAQYWLHNEMINLGGEKMSKSTGHIVDLAEAIERFSAMAVRFYYLRAHYRTPQEYTEGLLRDARASLDRLYAFRRRGSEDPGAAPDPAALEAFAAAMDDDFNTPAAVSVLFDVVREGNRRLDAGSPAGPWLAAFDEITAVLGLESPGPPIDAAALTEIAALASDEGFTGPPEEAVEWLVSARDRARDERDWPRADRIRDRLAEAGIVVEDTPDGARWYRR